MKTIMNKKLIMITALLLLLCLTACNGNSPGQETAENETTVEQETAENETTVEQETEESGTAPEQDETETENETGNETEAGPVNGEGAERKESAGMTEREQKYSYRGDAVLTKENFEETMQSLLYFQRKSRLEELPLTEEFFHECMEAFPYIAGVEEVNEFEVEFWGIREDGRWVCLCEFDKGHEWDRKSKCDYYYIVMDVENNQIASMEVTLVEKYVKKEMIDSEWAQ